MKIYIVGGYVRDRLLGLPGKDHDFVVVGATTKDMMAAGFKQVGADFPVYLHPVSGDEYALARTERKTKKGYHGFEVDFNPTVTLEQDLIRRDLTINAMAREVINWNNQGHAKLSDEIIDPFNGQEDLKNGVLRHVSKAFAEDPLRVLRVARFSSRYPTFAVAKETMHLMNGLVSWGELDHLTPERVWIETCKAIMEKQPTNYFNTLEECGALSVVLPELCENFHLVEGHLARAAKIGSSLPVRFAVLTSHLPYEECESFYARLKSPNEVSNIALKFNELLLDLFNDFHDNVENLILGLEKLNAFRDSNILDTLKIAVDCLNQSDFKKTFSKLKLSYEIAKPVSFSSLSVDQQTTLKGSEISRAIKQLRINTVNSVLEKDHGDTERNS